jgi:hypothetical protein
MCSDVVCSGLGLKINFNIFSGTEVSNNISSTIHLRYTIDRPSNGKTFFVFAMLTFDADAFGLTLPDVIFNQLAMPIPQCNYDDNTISWPQDGEFIAFLPLFILTIQVTLLSKYMHLIK